MVMPMIPNQDDTNTSSKRRGRPKGSITKKKKAPVATYFPSDDDNSMRSNSRF